MKRGFGLYLFQKRKDQSANFNVLIATAGFNQIEDALLVQSYLREKYTGLDFPLYEDIDFNQDGTLMATATPFTH